MAQPTYIGVIGQARAYSHKTAIAMTEEKSLKQRILERLEAWKGELDELKVQMALGKREAEDKYEQQKKQFLKWVQDNKHRLNDLEDEFGEDMEDLKDRWHVLMEKLESGKAETWEAFTEKRDDLNQHMETLRDWLKKATDKGSARARNLLDDLDNDLVKFRTRLDILALQMHLGRMEAEDEIKSARGKSGEIIENLKKRIADLSEDAEAKWEIVRRELGDAFHNIREAWKKNDDDHSTTA